MASLRERLAGGAVLLVDGAMGTMLFQRGLAPGQPPESLTLSRPGVLEKIAQLYLDAGADILTTNTFGASPLRLALHGLEARTEEINRAAALAARRVAGDRGRVAGSCGPCGRLLEPYGDVSRDEVFAGFRRQAGALIEAGVDCLIVETMTDLSEATLAVRAAREISADLPIFATMTFDPTPRGYFTVMGVSVAAAAAGLAEAGASAVGSNCGLGIEPMIEIARAFRAATTLPVVIQPNAGLPRTTATGDVYDESPAFFAGKADALLDVGVAVIGGCCGTTPEHIRALRAVIDGRSSQARARGIGCGDGNGLAGGCRESRPPQSEGSTCA
jgi:5-methyltetrahydrofolate--homocysteine methyltransferase